MSSPSRDVHAPWSPGPDDARCREAYRERLERANTDVSELTARERRFAPIRLVVFGAMIVLSFMALPRVAADPVWVLGPFLGLVGFVWVLRVHEGLRKALGRARFDQTQFEAGLDRLKGQASRGEAGLVAQCGNERERHLALDLDLFGGHSLFVRLCRAQTGSGRATLAEWLTQQVSVDEILARQAAIQELEPELDSRHAFAAACVGAGSLDPKRLIADFQGEGRPLAALARTRRLVGILLIVCTGSLAWVVFSPADPSLRLWVFAAQMVLCAVVHRWSKIPPVPSSDQMSHRLANLRALTRGLTWIESGNFKSSELRGLQEKVLVSSEGNAGSLQLERYASIYAYLVLGRTQFLAIIGFFLCWTPYFSLRLEQERVALGRSMPTMLEVLGKFEAISSLAWYAYEQPQDVYPSYLDNEVQGALEIEGLRHPLLHRETAVRNPVRVSVDADDPQLIVVSGSNMSGKSTYLRSIGLALVLGRLGTRAPATAMRSSNWRLGSHLRSQDSLSEGLSRFGAEVARVARIIQEARRKDPAPFLFLLDEVFSGTNSHDRQIAVDSLVEELVQERCVGWITTHDLALTKIAEKLAPRTKNQHFEDQFDEAHMAFDYRLRAGVVTKSNALALMRHAGLLPPA